MAPYKAEVNKSQFLERQRGREGGREGERKREQRAEREKGWIHVQCYIYTNLDNP